MLVLALTIALGSFGVTNAFAEEVKVESTSQVVVRADDVDLEIGESVSIGFYANGYVNVAGFHFTLVLPSNVTFAGLSMSSMYSDANYQHSVNGEEVSIICNSSNEIRDWDVTMFYIEVVAREVGYGEIWFRNASMVDVNANSLDCSTTPVGIIVEGEQNSVMMGDVDGDESVTLADLMLMQRYVIGSLGYEANFSTEAADVNGDYDINLTDCQHVQRYLVGKISFEELQALSGNGGGTENPDIPVNPDYPVGDIVYDVYDGSDVLQQALTIYYESGDTYFNYDGETLVGSTTFASMIEESEPAYKAMFVPYSSNFVYEFVLSEDGAAKLDAVYDVETMAKEQGFKFSISYTGDYTLFDGKEEFGNVEVFEDGTFWATVYFDINGNQTSRAINGCIEITEEKTAYAHIFGLYAKEIVIIPSSGYIMPSNQQREFEIQYVYPDGMTYVQTTYVEINEDNDPYDVAKELVYKYMPNDFSMSDFEVNMDATTNRIIVKVYSSNSGSGDVTEGKSIMFYVLVSDDKSEMLQPAGSMKIGSVEELKMMLQGMSNPPAETGMAFKGIYIDRELKTPYTEDMGMEVNELYINFGIVEGAGKLMSGVAGTYPVKVRNNDTGELTALDATVTLNDKDSSFTFTYNGKTVTGDAIMDGGSYDTATGKVDYASLLLISGHEFQISGSINFYNENPTDNSIYLEVYGGVDDFSGMTTKEELKEIAGEYTMYMTAMGIEMGKCSILLKDNGVTLMTMLYMPQLGTYEIVYTEKNVEIYITAADETMPGTIDFETKTIVLDMSSAMGGDGPSSGEIVDKVERVPATILLVLDGTVVEESKTEVYPYEDTYNALLQEIHNLTGGLENFKIYLDPELKEEVTKDNFKTVNTLYYVAISSSDLQNVNG